MSQNISRRDFLKVAILGTAASVTLAGCGPGAQLAYRRFGSYSAETSPSSIQDPYQLTRLQGPTRQERRGSAQLVPIEWGAAAAVVQQALQAEGEVAFVLGQSPDPLADLAFLLASSHGRMTLLRYSPWTVFNGRSTLTGAVQNLTGELKTPIFDTGQASLMFSFGADGPGTHPWHEAYSPDGNIPSSQYLKPPGYLIQFGAYRSQAAAKADEWYPIKPGSEAQLALALGRLVCEETLGCVPSAYQQVEIRRAAAQAGLREGTLRRLAHMFARASRSLAVAGGAYLGQTNALAAAQAVLLLNLVSGNQDQSGGLGLLPEALIFPSTAQRSSTLAEMSALTARMRAGKVKALLVHTANPVADLPQTVGFADAMKKVPLVISFSSFLDETTQQADFSLPDHPQHEGWGYQRVLSGVDRQVVAAMRPDVKPRYDTRSTVELLLDAIHAVGGELEQAVGFTNEADFLQKAVAALFIQPGSIDAVTLEDFWAQFLQKGGWWQDQPTYEPLDLSLDQVHPIDPGPARFTGDEKIYPFHLMPDPFASRRGQSGAAQGKRGRRHVALHPQAAQALGLMGGDVAIVATPAGEAEAIVMISDATHPEGIAISTAPDLSPFDLLAPEQNEAGGLAFMATRAQIRPLRKRHRLA